ncbi:MAG: tRNA-binding protein [Acidimicrobiia bacterium]|nr:tRNA-binding protein [Acidimicrobiia bacterium]MBT8217716.1 tRNA-binding protein [Acidimicrobiia bacterium]NNF09791.1 tRNA-binding protein [Acidimicrobiia bacterium]NNL68928.1 tRNA-binding protein [Acidimicrobiia bacterium]
MPTIEDFEGLAVRVGTVLRAEPNTTARDAALKLWIDFGDLGELQSSAKITDHYRPDELPGRQVVAVTGFEPMRIGGFRSDVLVLGALTPDGVVLLNLDSPVEPGSPVG